MPVSSSSRGIRRIAVGEEGRRSNYRTSTFRSRNAGGGLPLSIKGAYQRQFSSNTASIGSSLCWFFKQISPGIVLVICFFTFRNLDRPTQLKLMGYVTQESLVPESRAVASNQDQRLRHRLGSRVPQALENLADLSTLFNPKTDTPYFWDIHFAGEIIAESVFTKCHFLIQACEHGLKQPDYNDEKLQVFETPHNGALYVNVDTTTKQGIQRAKKLGLAEAHMAEVVMSPELHLFASNIFSSSHKGRMFALFRDPIHRAVTMYHYLSSASWDPLYNPQLKIMSIEEYAKSPSVENNWMTRFLVNKQGGKLEKEDMVVAKEILRTKCLVGLYEDMDVSMRRFQGYFMWSQKAPPGQVQECRTAVLAAGDRRHNTPEFEVGTSMYEALANNNQYDMELYQYAK
eukprot:CAMPEP_0119023678 /NCGR_PEP_ID=MMETSP1176-20130426/30413_1 /TAXON_ID=265551 /ORGANISM="Synedropsis recta cf, Strain CCMP1620" /LENGTH=400 /DNA_ID=CAMNT_0006978787 /DNA_START=10 /DNA_END=1209 /DNA_ORIENTATION=+